MTKNQTIKKLPDVLINQIAAGEVVERPASALKEILENSIDAGARKIVVELKNGGKSLIKVIDDGIGLSKENFLLVFERHATSKIGSAEDLVSNRNLGFRGEALSAIAAVSEVEFASNGYAINSDGEIKAKAMAPGTQVTVGNLFFNVPARLKFLKTDATEYKQCLTVLEAYALCYKEVSFKLYHNDKLVFDYAGVPDLDSRIQQVVGKDLQLLEVNYLGKETSLRGFVGKPETATEKPRYQYLFVNGRPIDAPYFAHAVRQAFGSFVFPSEKPQFFLYLDVQPEDVDMNVHPRKLEARFHFQAVLYGLIQKAVRHALESNSLEKTLSFGKATPDKFEDFTEGRAAAPPPAYLGRPDKFEQRALSEWREKADIAKYPAFRNGAKTGFSPEFETKLENRKKVEFKPDLKPICQIQNCYILCESENGVVFIDQHAAHEKVMYFKLKEAYSKSKHSQALLTPLQIELSASELEVFLKAEKVLLEIGFEIEKFGANAIVVNAVPSRFSKNDIKVLISGILEDLTENKNFEKLNEIEDIVINYAACRGAVKFGQKLSESEMESLIYEMSLLESEQYSCPHGRPTMLKISFEDLNKQFKR